MAKMKTRGGLKPLPKIAEELRREWGDVPVIDAMKDLRVFVMPEDVAAATRKDPGFCVFAQACRRSYGSTKVMFWRTVAYVELPNAEGGIRVERFMLGDGVQALIRRFDEGKGVIPKAGFVLHAPPRGRKLDHARRAKSKRVKALRERRKILGLAAVPRDTAFRDKKVVLDMAVRSGVGAVHFSRAVDEEEMVSA